jgi:hypothetical protein
MNMVRFSFYFALVVLFNLGVHGQNNNFNTLPSNSVDQASLFGRFQKLLDNQNQDQPAPVSCFRVRPNIKNAYPLDNTKYFICRDEQRYEIFTCPNGGIFNDREKACIDLCEQKKPCLNQGQCIILSNLTLQCVCQRDWTGDRCEIPLSSCANNPCGPNAECRMLKTSDYSQDYVCVCNNHETYGRNCQQTVPNPCLANIQQFHPFAFSRRAYINCDDELIFFQPCNANLYWNQENKRCDRSLPLLLRAPFLILRNRNGQREQDQVNIPQPAQWQRSQTIQNQQPFTNSFVETTTVPPRIFHLQGFSSQNLGQENTQWQNNGNSQFQSVGQPQPWLQDQNQQTTTGTVSQLPTSIQPNNQLGFTQQQPWQNNQLLQNQNGQFPDSMTGMNNQNFPVQSQSGQWSPSSFETITTVPNNNRQQGLSMLLLRGWQPDQRGASNQIDQQGTLNSIPTRQARSWRA